MENFTREPKIVLYGICIVSFMEGILRVFHSFIEKDPLGGLIIVSPWLSIPSLIVTGMFLAWICDCYTRRYYVAVMSIFALILSTFILFLACIDLLPMSLRIGLFYLGSGLQVIHNASTGILHSVLLDQISMDILPDNQGLVRKYLFYYILSLKLSLYACIWIGDTMEKNFIMVLSALMGLVLIGFLLILLLNVFNFFKAPYKLNMLNTCVHVLIVKNIHICRRYTERVTSIEIVVFKFLQVIFVLFWVCLAYLCGGLGTKAVYNMKTFVVERKYGTAAGTLSWVLLVPVFELWIIPLLRKYTFFKTSLHHFAVGFTLLSLALILGGFFQLNLENISLTQPSRQGYGQLRFFNVLAQEILISISSSSLHVQPFGTAFFLRIPTRGESKATVEISGLMKDSFKSSVNVKEMTSRSFIVDSEGIKGLGINDPLGSLFKLDEDKSYFYIFQGFPFNMSLTFLVEGKEANSISFSTGNFSLESITPGQYGVAYTDNNGLLNNLTSSEFKAGEVYCVFVFYRDGDIQNIAATVYHITTVRKMNLIIVLLQILVITTGKAVLMISLYYFTHTESPFYLRATTFTIVELLIQIGMMVFYYKNLIVLDMSSVRLFAISMFLFALTLFVLKIALIFNFSPYSIK